jgi:hypothetical protein
MNLARIAAAFCFAPRSSPSSANGIVYFRPFRGLGRLGARSGARSLAAGAGASVRGTGPPRPDFGCFGFFASRFDRFCPFAIADSCYCRARRASDPRLLLSRRRCSENTEFRSRRIGVESLFYNHHPKIR